ncbi:MAG TPA: divergent polysaccharide deacetylase family protein [Candidatus Acidoferrales bacterium]|nr:divergent polysaccharide deacetylase family protein [Candidatus Acidoferrales bacterium]
MAAPSPRVLTPQNNLLRFAAWHCVLLAFLILAAGCAKKPPSSSELRAITRDLVAAAQKTAGRNAQVVIQPEMGKLGNGSAHLVADDIFIQLPAGSKSTAVEAALDRAASRYGLTRTPRSASLGVLRFDYSLNGQRTQTIHILTSVQAGSNRETTDGANSPRLAIIIDDLGTDPAPAETILNLPFPLTLSVLPNEMHSRDIAEEAFQHGDQVLLHLPMEAEGDAAKPEAIELRVGISESEVDRLLAEMLDSVPHAIGVNNHEGSRATADPQLMAAVMSAIRARHLFFVDSRTTVATVAYDAARHAGVPAAYRKVFLDDVETREAVLQQLDVAARDATRDGWAIAIGHPHPETLAALAEGLPQMQARGVRLVFVSDLVQ